MKNKVIETIKRYNMVDNTECIEVCVSGGVDSVSLLHFINNNINKRVIAVHVNHMLRGSESDRDENFVKDICNKWNIYLVSKKIDILNYSKKNKIGIEECARIERYKFFNEVSKEYNSKIATAHTLSDSIETFIFNFARGTSLSGLCGIPPVRENIIRPFINVSRSEIEEYAYKNKLEYVNDTSNFSNIYSRNKIRHFIIPELKKINKSFENNARKCISNLIDENNFMTNLSALEFKNTNYEIEKIKNLDESMQNRVLKLILERFGFNIEYKHISLAKMLICGKINAFNISNDRKIKVKNKLIICENVKKQELTNNQKKFIVLMFKEQQIHYFTEKNMIFDTKGNDISDFEFRNRKEGDKFSLSKRNCTKSLKKLFNEFKIPIHIRDNLKILFDRKNKEIVWIESIGVSKNYVVSSETNKIGLIVEK